MKRRRVLRRREIKKGGKCHSGSFGQVCEIKDLQITELYIYIFDINDVLVNSLQINGFINKLNEIYVYKEFNKNKNWQGEEINDLSEIINVNYMGKRLEHTVINTYTILNTYYTRFQYINIPYLLYKKMLLTSDMKYELDILKNMYIKLSKFIDIMQNNGIRHNDIKPDNILIDTENESYLGDFGTLTFTNDNNIFDEDADLIVYGNGTPRWVHPLLMSKVGNWGEDFDYYKTEHTFYINLGFTREEADTLFTSIDFSDQNSYIKYKKNNILFYRDKYALILSILYLLKNCKSLNDEYNVFCLNLKSNILHIDNMIKQNTIKGSLLYINSVYEDNLPIFKVSLEPPSEPLPNPFMNFKFDGFE